MNFYVAEVGKALKTPSLPHTPIPAKSTKLLTHVNNFSHHLSASVAPLRLYSHRRNVQFTSSEYATAVVDLSCIANLFLSEITVDRCSHLVTTIVAASAGAAD